MLSVGTGIYLSKFCSGSTVLYKRLWVQFLLTLIFFSLLPCLHWFWRPWFLFRNEAAVEVNTPWSTARFWWRMSGVMPSLPRTSLRSEQFFSHLIPLQWFAGICLAGLFTDIGPASSIPWKCNASTWRVVVKCRCESARLNAAISVTWFYAEAAFALNLDKRHQC